MQYTNVLNLCLYHLQFRVEAFNVDEDGEEPVEEGEEAEDSREHQHAVVEAKEAEIHPDLQGSM